MADFKKQGGSLTGREERYDGFEGEPRAVGNALGGSSSGLTGSTGTGTTGSGYGSSGYGSTGTSGPHSSNLENKVDPRVDSDRDGSRNLGANQYGTSTTGKKPGLMDKLNPMKDADHDGKKGFME